jgi:branched-chain amino acid aminotransferase
VPFSTEDGIFYFLKMDFVNVNGKIFNREKAFLSVDNHSYRYGNGLFETVKVSDENILLADLHFERLFHSLSLLKYSVPRFFTSRKISKEILQLCRKNNCSQSSRVRLSLSGGYGGLFDGVEKLHYIIECWSLVESTYEINTNGLIIDILPSVNKSCDVFSNLKSANHLPYVMAAKYAKDNKLNDCLVMNVYERISDSSIANVFWVKNKKLFTPPLTEGCIAGVMRKFLIQKLQKTKYNVHEKSLTIYELQKADEVFLTNAIAGIRWVSQFRNKIYGKKITEEISKKIS